MSARRDAIDAALANRGIDITGDLSRYQLKELIRVVEVMGGRIRFAGGDQASYDTDPDQGANAAIVYTAVPEGAAGNLIQIQYANTASDGHSDVTTSNTIGADGVQTIVVGIKTGVTLASEVITALDTEDLSSLMTYAYKSGNDGSGTVATMAAKTLAGGADAGFVITPAA